LFQFASISVMGDAGHRVPLMSIRRKICMPGVSIN
jgi:hypothetical protein